MGLSWELGLSLEQKAQVERKITFKKTRALRDSHRGGENTKKRENLNPPFKKLFRKVTSSKESPDWGRDIREKGTRQKRK